MISRRNVKMLSAQAGKRYVLCKSNLEGRMIWKWSTYKSNALLICMYTLRVNVLLGLEFNIFIRFYFQFEIKSCRKKR